MNYASLDDNEIIYDISGECMNRKKQLCVALLVLCTFSIAAHKNFNRKWQLMQCAYNQICTHFAKVTETQDANYCHDHWLRAKKNLRHFLMGAPNQEYLKHPVLAGNMVRSGIGITQHYEVNYITYCLSPNTYALIKKACNSPHDNLPRECAELNCSTNSLGHLFYAAKILEILDDTPQTIVEFGGGYGNLARIFKEINPQATLILIDLPELLAIQYLHLRQIFPENQVIIHTQTPLTIVPHAINLVPVYALNEIDSRADVFVSTFALSEATVAVQTMLSKKNFFNARLCYIVGQLNGWGSLKFVHHNHLIKAVRTLYQRVYCQPYHLFIEGLHSYELIGKNA